MLSSEENVTTSPEPETTEVQTMQPSPDGFHPRPEARRQTAILVAAAALAVLALLIYSGIHSRAVAESRLMQRTEEAAIPTVGVVFPREGAPTQEIILPGNTQAFSDAPIYARTNGYLKHWYFDIGAHVQKGQLLAEIETPEVDQQLLQARADLETAQAPEHCQDHRDSLAGPGKQRLRVAAGDRPGGKQSQRGESRGGIQCRQRAAP